MGWVRRRRTASARATHKGYLRATLTVGPDGIPIATPAPVQDSSMLMLLARADCLLVREPHAPPAKAGERCSIIRLAL
jgi:molybdopterin molybdotransferase